VLATLAFRIPPDRLDQVLGHVTASPLTEEFEKAWDRLPRIRLNSGRPGTPKYASLAAALRAVTARPVRLFGRWDLSEAEQVAGARALLLTTAPIDPRLLHTAVTPGSTWSARVKTCGPLPRSWRMCQSRRGPSAPASTWTSAAPPARPDGSSRQPHGRLCVASPPARSSWMDARPSASGSTPTATCSPGTTWSLTRISTQQVGGKVQANS
jgi:hypothetical protein